MYVKIHDTIRYDTIRCKGGRREQGVKSTSRGSSLRVDMDSVIIGNTTMARMTL